MTKDNNLTIDEGWKKFLRHCKIKDLSKHTIIYYQKSYNYFIRFLKDEFEEDDSTNVKEINKDLIEEFTMWLDDNYNMKNTTINTRLRGVRTFVYYLRDQKLIRDLKIDLLRSDKEIKETYTNAELKKLLKKPNLNESSFAVYRNWVIINFLLATGVRSRTLINLKIKDINIEEAIVHLKTIKNRKEQIIPLSKSLIKVLLDYLEYRQGKSDDYLICNIYGNKLKSSSLNSAIRTYNLDRGVSKTSIHLFRHTFAKKWILRGGDSFRLQKILGHSSMKMVREYVNMYNDDLKQDFNHFNPLEEFANSGDYIQL